MPPSTMSRDLPSFGVIGGWLQCPSWEKDRKPVGPAAKYGKAVHACAEYTLAHEIPDLTALAHLHGVASKDFERLSSTWKAIAPWVLERRAEGGLPERGYAVDVLSGAVRFIGARVEGSLRKLAQEHEMVGALDILVLKDEEAVVYDLKSGRAPSDSHDEQMRALGYCIAKIHAKPVTRLVVVSCDERGAIEHNVGEMDVIDADAWGWELRAAVAREKRPRAGPWCDASYCGARTGCAAYQGLRGENTWR